MSTLRMGRVALQALILALLGACASGGGGGGGSVVSPPPPPPPPPPSTPLFPPLAPPHADGDFPGSTSSEYLANWGVAGTNAIVAWQNGATGAGVLVGVIDDGIDPSHPELTGRISPNSVDIVSGRNALVTTQSHGSELSSLIAGNYNNSQTVGVAFDATILAVRADNGSGTFSTQDLANAMDYARAQGVDVINLSLGSSSPTGQAFRDAIQRATQAGIIIVVSAGNDGDDGATNPNYPAFLATDASVSNGLIMIAGGLNSDGSVNPVSNPPGTAANWYLTAPGWSIIVPDHGPAGPVVGYQTCGLGTNGDLCRIQGTSYASPHVTGAVALVMDAFPSLTPLQVVDLLFTTTDDTGAAGVDSVNGRGRLNIGRAFEPVGALAVPLAAGQGFITPTSSLGIAGAAFGDGITGNAATWSVAGFDSYNRTFAVQLAGNWAREAAGPAHIAQAPQLWRTGSDAEGVRMQMAFADDIAPDTMRTPIDRAELDASPTRIDAALAYGLTVSFAAHGAGAAAGEGDAMSHLDFANPDLSLRLTRRINEVLSLSLIAQQGEAPHGVNFTDRAGRAATAARASLDFGGQALELTFGRLQEEAGLLGLTWAPALGDTPQGETRFAGLGWRFQPAPSWRVGAAAEYGVADLGATGWLNVDAPLRTSAYSLQVAHDWSPAWFTPFGANGHGSVQLSVSQPLRVEQGELSFMAPTATKYGLSSLTYESRAFEPSPSGREIRFGLGYTYFSGELLSAFGEALYVQDPGHVDGAAPDAVFRLGLRVAR